MSSRGSLRNSNSEEMYAKDAKAPVGEPVTGLLHLLHTRVPRSRMEGRLGKQPNTRRHECRQTVPCAGAVDEPGKCLSL